MMGSFVSRGNQYIQFVQVLYCKLPTIDKHLPTFPHKVWSLNRQPQRWEASVLPLYHCGPSFDLTEGPKVKFEHLRRFLAHDFLYVGFRLQNSRTNNKLDLRIREPMQICIHRKDNSPKPVNHLLTLKEGAKGQV